jgi:hypothetical protein
VYSRAGLIVLALVCQSALAGAKEPSYATDKGSVLLTAMGSPSGFSPSIRVFTAPNFAVGGGFSLSSVTQTDESGSDNILNLSLGPAATYFFGKPGSTLLPYVDGDVTLEQFSGLGFSRVGAGVGLELGVCQLIGTHGAMMAEAGYSYYRYSVDTSRGGNGGIYLAVGFGGFIF